MKNLALTLLSCALAGCSAGSKTPRDGDIIFQTSQSAQSEAVQRATRSRYSHMGLILFRDGQPFVFEAGPTTRFTPLRDWIERGKDGHYVIKRILEADRVLSPDQLRKLHEEAARYEGKPYDTTFEWSDNRIYCSELVWKTYDRALGIQIGKPQKMSEFNLADPAVRQKLAERYGDQVPLSETVISPQAMFDSPNLEKIREGWEPKQK